MRGIVHEPQVNLGANQKFSPIDVFFLKKNNKKIIIKKGDKPWNFDGLVKHQMAPLPSLQNGQVTKSKRTYTLREFPERFAKRIGWGCMNYHLFQKDSQSVFSKKIKSKSKSQNRERMSWTLYNFPLHCIVSYEVRIYQISRQRLHASASLKIMLTA